MKSDNHKTAESFHPTLHLAKLLKYWFASFKNSKVEKSLEGLFPGNSTVLVDSGRSAFALVIEELNLTNKTLILPAYVCDALLPVLLHYNIKPIFLDIDKETYQPPPEAYSDDVLKKADAVMLVATYGKKPKWEILNHLIEKGKVIIEDFAMRSPLMREPLLGNARIYSLPKTLPVADGGLAVIKKKWSPRDIDKHRGSLTYLKNVMKLIPKISSTIARLRDRLKKNQTEPTWSGIKNAGALTKVIFADYCTRTNPKETDLEYPYCHPLKTANPKESVSRLRKHNISAELVWNRPIIENLKAQAYFGIDDEDFPVTRDVSSHIVCAPLWHIEDKLSYDNYTSTLEEILADLSSK